jgi:hypothetical protein
MHPAVLLGFVLLPGLLKITNEDVRLARFLAPIRPPAYPPTHPHPPAPHPTHQRPAKTCRYRAALSMSSRSSPQGHRSRSAARAVQTFKFVCYFHPRSAAPLPHMIKKIRSAATVARFSYCGVPPCNQRTPYGVRRHRAS